MINMYAEEFSANGYTGDGKTLSDQVQSNNSTPDQGSGVTVTNKSENVLGAWLLVAGVLVGLMFVLERFSVGQTFGNVKLGFYNMVVIGFYSLLFITLGKVFFAKVRVPGLTPLFMSA